jgi:hypothetical protein
VDDGLLFHDETRTLHHWRVAIGEFLAGFRLKLHEREARVYPVHTGIPFLGFRVYPDHRRLKPANGYAYRQRLKTLIVRYATGEIDFERLAASVQGWVNHARYGDTWGLRKALLTTTPIPRRT